MAQTRSCVHMMASTSAPLLVASETSTSAAPVADTDRSPRCMTVVSGGRNGSDLVGQLYQMVKVNVNGVIKNLMIPVETCKKNPSAGPNDATSKPDVEASVTPDRPDVVSTPQPLVKPATSNTKLVLVSQSRSILSYNSKTSDLCNGSTSSLLSPSSAGTCSVSSVQSSYGSPTLTPPMCNATISHVSPASIINKPATRHVLVAEDVHSMAESNVLKTHVIQPVVGMNKHLVIPGVKSTAGSVRTPTVAGGVRFMMPVQLTDSAVAAPRPTAVTQTVATSVAPLMTPPMRMVHVVTVPNTRGSPVRAPVVVGGPPPGAKQLVFTSTIPVLRHAHIPQIPNGVQIIQPSNTTNQAVHVPTTVRSTATPVVGTFATESVLATQSRKPVVVHNTQVQKSGHIVNQVVAGNNMRTVVLTVPATSPHLAKTIVAPVTHSPKPKLHAQKHISSTVPPQKNNSAITDNQVRPMITVVRSPSGSATAVATTTYTVVNHPGRPSTSKSTCASGNGTNVVTLTKPLANAGNNAANSEYGSPHLKIGDVFSLQEGDSRIPSPLQSGAAKPVLHSSVVQTPVVEPLAESPLPPNDPGYVVLASWSKNDNWSSDNANDDSSDKTIEPCPWRKKSIPYRRTTRLHRRTYGKFFQDAVASLTSCRVALKPLELNGRTRVRASEFEAQLPKFTRRSGQPLRRAAPRCFLDAADPRRGDSYSIDTDGRTIMTIFVTECVRLTHGKARPKRSKATATPSPNNLPKATPTTNGSPLLAKNEAPKRINQKVAAPTPIAPKMEANSNSETNKKLRYLMVKTNAGTFLVPISSDGGLINGGNFSFQQNASGTVAGRMVTRRTTASASAASDLAKVADKLTKKVAVNDAAKVVSSVMRTTGRSTQYIVMPTPSQATNAGRSLLPPRIKSEPMKPGYEDAIEAPVPTKRFKKEFDTGNNDAAAFTQISPPPSMLSLSNQDRITQLRMELKKMQDAVEALRHRKLDASNVAVWDGDP